MDAIRKAVKPPNPFNRSSKHEKMSDKWSDYKYRDKVRDGIVFHVKYLGSVLVSELTEEGESYGDGMGADAVKTLVAMTKASGKKLPAASLTISPAGLRIINMASEAIISDLDIYRICFCTADRQHERVFAYIARNRENETMECHAFLCPKRKIAEAIALTVAESFQIAKDILVNETATSSTASGSLRGAADAGLDSACGQEMYCESTANAPSTDSVSLSSNRAEFHRSPMSSDLMIFPSTEKLSSQRASSYSEFL